MNNNLANKLKVVGLIIMLGLLLFCAWKDVKRRTKTMEEVREEQTIQEDESEPSRVVDPSKPMVSLTFDDGPGK